MAFQEAIEQMSELIRWNPEPKNAEDKSLYLGPVVTGYYLEKKTKVGQNESNLYELEVIDPAGAAGRRVSMWGSSLLDGKFDDIPLGCMVRITFLGVSQPKTPKGRAYQNFKVEFDKDARRPMREAGAVSTPAPTSYGAPAPAAPGVQTPEQRSAFGDGF